MARRTKDERIAYLEASLKEAQRKRAAADDPRIGEATRLADKLEAFLVAHGLEDEATVRTVCSIRSFVAAWVEEALDAPKEPEA